MIKEFVDEYFAGKDLIRDQLRKGHPQDYMDLVKSVAQVFKKINTKNITELSGTGHEGALLYIFNGIGYDDNNWWYVKVWYGSCSGCDALESIRNYSNDLPTEEEVNQYMQLALHIVQGIKKIGEADD